MPDNFMLRQLSVPVLQNCIFNAKQIFRPSGYVLAGLLVLCDDFGSSGLVPREDPTFLYRFKDVIKNEAGAFFFLIVSKITVTFGSVIESVDIIAVDGKHIFGSSSHVFRAGMAKAPGSNFVFEIGSFAGPKGQII